MKYCPALIVIVEDAVVLVQSRSLLTTVRRAGALPCCEWTGRVVMHGLENVQR